MGSGGGFGFREALGLVLAGTLALTPYVLSGCSTSAPAADAARPEHVVTPAPAPAPVALAAEPAVASAPPAAAPAPAPPAGDTVTPHTNGAAAPAQAALPGSAPTRVSGKDPRTVASTGPGLLRLSWYTDEACAESGPPARADVDEAQRRIVIEQRRLGAQYRCAGRPQRYRTTLTGLVGGVYSLAGPGLGPVFIQVPAAVTPGPLRVRTVEEPVATAPPAGPRPPARPLPPTQDITDPWR